MLIEARYYYVIDVNLPEDSFIYILNLLLGGNENLLQRLRVLMFEEILKMQRILDPIFVLIVFGFKRRNELRYFFCFVKVDEMREAVVSFVMHHHVQVFLLLFGG